MTTLHLKNSINPSPLRYGFFLITLVCLALSPTANNVWAGTITSRSGELGISKGPISIQLPAQGSQEDRHQPVIITFDAPGAGTTGPFQGTYGFDINPAGTIVGADVDDMTVLHGFLRAPDGTITTFEAPGSGTGFFEGTIAYSINPAGAIAGVYGDAPNNVNHGFLRALDGTFTTFEAPGSGTGTFQGTEAFNINPAGTIAGIYKDNNNVNHGYVRAHNGTITTFDAPGAGTGPFQGTVTAASDGLNPAGAITGGVIDANNVFHGYLRAPNGTFTTFDAPGAGTGANQGTNAGGINSAETISGSYVDGNNVFHGFVRARNGTITTFDVPGAGTGANQGTFGENINDSGVIDGYYIDANGVAHGFVRDRGGAITTFDAPGAGTGSGQGTFIGAIGGAINPEGAITGNSVDTNNVNHGFLRSP